VSRPGRFIPKKWEAKKVKLCLSLRKYHSRKKTWDVEVYLLALVFPELLVVSVTPWSIHPQVMGGKKGKAVPKLK
jgi:uncharacterized membrane protein YfbV (UPF0208 family)